MAEKSQTKDMTAMIASTVTNQRKESKLYKFVQWIEATHPEYMRGVYSGRHGLTMSQARYVEKLLDGKYPGGLWARVSDRKLLANYVRQYKDELSTEG